MSKEINCYINLKEEIENKKIENKEIELRIINFALFLFILSNIGFYSILIYVLCK